MIRAARKDPTGHSPHHLLFLDLLYLYLGPDQQPVRLPFHPPSHISLSLGDARIGPPQGVCIQPFSMGRRELPVGGRCVQRQHAHTQLSTKTPFVFLYMQFEDIVI